MAIKVKFRFNKLTGEVEEFLVEQDLDQAQEQHDQTHEQITREIGRLIDRFPRSVQLTGAAAAEAMSRTYRDQDPAADEGLDTDGDETTRDETPTTRRRH